MVLDRISLCNPLTCYVARASLELSSLSSVGITGANHILSNYLMENEMVREQNSIFPKLKRRKNVREERKNILCVVEFIRKRIKVLRKLVGTKGEK